MILHIEFSDGSNPYVFYPRAGFESLDYSPESQGRAICKEFERWKRAGYFPAHAFTVHYRGVTIEHDYNGVWFIRYGGRVKVYKHLGNAIRGAIKLLNKRSA